MYTTIIGDRYIYIYVHDHHWWSIYIHICTRPSLVIDIYTYMYTTIIGDRYIYIYVHDHHWWSAYMNGMHNTSSIVLHTPYIDGLFQKWRNGLRLLCIKPSTYALVNWVIIGSDNGLSLVRHQAITWTNAALLHYCSWEHNLVAFCQSKWIFFKKALEKLSAKYR